MSRLLIVKTSSMGDVIHNLPVVADIRRERPELVVDWLVEEAYAELVGLARGVDRVLPVAFRRWRRNPGDPAMREERRAFSAALRSRRYDVVLDTQGLVKSAWLARRARLAPGGHRVGFSTGLAREPLARLFYDRGHAVDPRLHAVERMRALAAAALGYAKHPLGPPRFDIDVPVRAFAWLPASPTARHAVLLHATARPEKAWPHEYWVALIARLAAAAVTPVLPSGTAVEREAAEALVREASRSLAPDGVRPIVAPPLSLPDVAALLASASVVVGVDTGLLHLAAALRTPTVGLFGATPRWRYAPYWSDRAVNLGGFGELGAQPAVSDVIDGLVQLDVLTAVSGRVDTSGATSRAA